MGFLDALFGRTRVKKAKMGELFALVTAQVDLERDLGWKPGGRAGLCLKTVPTTDFKQVEADLEALVKLAAEASKTQVKISQDEFNYRWLVFTDPDFEDLVGVIHIAAKELQDRGYGEQLLAAIFRFSQTTSPVPSYLVYNYKEGGFYPFIPASGKKRDNAGEMRAGALLGKHLPAVRDQASWHPLWGLPV
ncbi:MAG TPA: hypothetical protein GXZ82_15325 [Firmicutes bacterium]|jgi:hypothetical protein|nr:hypothetical protein [Bacillota bacterium]